MADLLSILGTLISLAYAIAILVILIKLVKANNRSAAAQEHMARLLETIADKMKYDPPT